jgi:hypothetical protein
MEKENSEQVIGYIDYSFNSDFLIRNRINSDELIGTTVQLCFANVVDSKTLKKDNDVDCMISKMVSENVGILVNFNENDFEAEILFSNPMPEYIFNKYYSGKKPMYVL